MIRARPSSGRFREERGAVLVMVGLWLPILVLVMALVIDVGNWFEHKRHLQMQADAAALAGGGLFGGVLGGGCDSTAIQTAAQEYGGGTYNAQIGGTPPARVHMQINSQTYFGQSSPVDTTVNTADPCTASMLDVKMTETDLPWFLKAGGLVPFINAHARVSVNQIDYSNGALPIGVPDVDPHHVAVTFVDESCNDKSLGSAQLVKTGTDTSGNAIWSTSSAVPVTFQPSTGCPSGYPTNRMNVGVRVALSGGSSTTCGDPLVTCYDAGSSNGLVYIRGYSNAGSASQTGTPLLRDVSLPPAGGTCPDPYFDASTTSCTVQIQATVDWGNFNPSNMALFAFVNGGKTRYDLKPTGTPGVWQSDPANLPSIAPGAGPLSIDLQWAQEKGTVNGKNCKSGNGNPCPSGDFGNVQRVFSATPSRSGPIQLVQVSEGLKIDTNSFEICSSVQTNCTHNLGVQVKVQGNLQNASSVNDPVVCLRLAGSGSACGGGTSQNQSLDCDPSTTGTNTKLKDELANGCKSAYAVNTGQLCPNSTTALWGSPSPWHCVAIQTGAAVNQVPEGLNIRILGSSKPTACTSPNHWSNFPNLNPADPRIVQVFLVPYGSFSGSGSGTVPVELFATFYVTGWTGQGQGFNNPCQGNGDDPVPQNDPGVIVGHFIKYINTLGSTSGSQPCNLSGFGSCVVQLTE